MTELSASSTADVAADRFSGTVGWDGWTAHGGAFGEGPPCSSPAVGPDTAEPEEIVASSRGKEPPAQGRLVSDPFIVSQPYLNFRIAGGDYEYKTCLNLVIDRAIVRSETGRATEWLHAASFDVSRWLGREAHLELVDEASGQWGWICLASTSLGCSPVTTDRPDRLYQEPLRPRLHFTARQWQMQRTDPVERQEGWLNDLNGLVHVDGEYHMFAQRWNKCWIHAVSTDLVHWTEISPAFFEESLGTGVQSGSCVVDYDNTSGLGKRVGPPPMVAFWSRNDNRSQCLSYSLDRGRTWTHHPENPLLDKPERDPIVLRDHQRSQWIMVMYGDNQYHLLRSDDLLHWQDLHHPIGDSFECPDFFELPLVGTDESRWVLVRGDGRYSVGTFDGAKFTEETAQLQCDAGPNFYATQSWGIGNHPAPRRVQVAWMRGGSYPHMPFNQQVSLPCELTLHRTEAGPRLCRTPIAEFDILTRRRHSWPGRVLEAGDTWMVGAAWPLLRLTYDVVVRPGAALHLHLCGVSLKVTADGLHLLGSEQSTLTPLTHLDVVIDTTSIEVFANHGEASLTACTLPRQPDIRVSAEGRSCTIRSFSLAELDSIWPFA